MITVNTYVCPLSTQWKPAQLRRQQFCLPGRNQRSTLCCHRGRVLHNWASLLLAQIASFLPSVTHPSYLWKSYDCIIYLFPSTCFSIPPCLQIFLALGASHCFLFYFCIAYVFGIYYEFKEHMCMCSERKYSMTVISLIYILISSTAHQLNGFYEERLSGKCKERQKYT